MAHGRGFSRSFHGNFQDRCIEEKLAAPIRYRFKACDYKKSEVGFKEKNPYTTFLGDTIGK